MSHEIEAKFKVADFRAVRRSLSGLGAIYLELDRKQDALTALHEALAINPHLEGAKYVAGRLRRALGAK